MAIIRRGGRLRDQPDALEVGVHQPRWQRRPPGIVVVDRAKPLLEKPSVNCAGERRRWSEAAAGALLRPKERRERGQNDLF
jgi:hypothetical protein